MFYTLLEFPEYLAQHAAGDVRSHALLPWQGRRRLDGYVRTANGILFNPDGMFKRVEREYEQRAESETGTDGQGDLENQIGLAQIEQVNEDVPEKAEPFEVREALLRKRFADSAN